MRPLLLLLLLTGCAPMRPVLVHPPIAHPRSLPMPRR